MTKGQAHKATTDDGRWEVTVSGDCDEDFLSHLHHVPTGYTASLGAMDMTGQVDDGWDEATMDVPEAVQAWALEVEDQFTTLNQLFQD